VGERETQLLATERTNCFLLLEEGNTSREIKKERIEKKSLRGGETVDTSFDRREGRSLRIPCAGGGCYMRGRSVNGEETEECKEERRGI